MKKIIALLMTITLAGIGMQESTARETTSTEKTDTRLDQLYGSHQEFRIFFENFQQAISKNDKATVANMILYPITINTSKGVKTINDSAEFISCYDLAITNDIKKKVLNQRYDSLFARDIGIMIGEHGEIWFNGICKDKKCVTKDIKIITINN
ncbi:hypothetical protein GIX45_13270 [Erwinia sp. CPCC 100877]|nr:hypothetical protein [Erwinia sp. CPCC 100877]